MIFLKNMPDGDKLKKYLQPLSVPGTDMVSFVDDVEMTKFYELMLPSDCIIDTEITGDERDRLLAEFGMDEYSGDTITKRERRVPLDVVVANTIPLKNVEISYYDSDQDSNIFQKVCLSEDITVLSFDGTKLSVDPGSVYKIIDHTTLSNLREYISTRTDEELETMRFVLGSLEVSRYMHDTGGTMRCLIIAFYDSFEVGINPIIDKITAYDKTKISTLSDGSIRMPEDKAVFLMSTLSEDITDALAIYYSINVGLLNPVIEDVYQSKVSRTTHDRPSFSKYPDKKKKIKYVKKHLIRMQDVTAAFEKRGFVRKAMIWYVTGHWREYKSGKRIFVQGYWKGALRHSKDATFKNLEPREREMVIPENKEDTCYVETT